MLPKAFGANKDKMASNVLLQPAPLFDRDGRSSVPTCLPEKHRAQGRTRPARRVAAKRLGLFRHEHGATISQHSGRFRGAFLMRQRPHLGNISGEAIRSSPDCRAIFVELSLGQHLIAPVVKHVSGCQVHRQTAPGARCLQAVAQPSHCHAVTSRSAPHRRA